MGEMTDEDGVHLGFTNFTGSDGSHLRVLYEGFGNSAGAKKYLEKRIGKAAKLIDRGDKVDSTGKIVGERAEMLLRLNGGKEAFAVLWTDGELFHEIHSLSRESVLQLEKVYRYR